MLHPGYCAAMSTRPLASGTDDAAARVEGYDLARALAIVGMVIVNFTVVMGAEAGDPAWLRRLVSSLEGRAAAVFVTLAGVGMSLMSRRARETGHAGDLRSERVSLLKRALFLFVIGILYQGSSIVC